MGTGSQYSSGHCQGAHSRLGTLRHLLWVLFLSDGDTHSPRYTVWTNKVSQEEGSNVWGCVSSPEITPVFL